MNLLNSDELRIVISFLSLEDKINLCISSKLFIPFIKKREIALCSIEKIIHNHFSIVMKHGSELILAVNNNFIMYLDESSIQTPSRLHPVFRIQNTYPTCINCECGEKRLGNIFIGIHRGDIPQYLRTIYYIQRKIPYCIHCFNKWGVDAYLHHPQCKEKM
tara:strand:+ start:249 stop:731 length:483 start_codon:yes stop_codon:yes gene_type:complete